MPHGTYPRPMTCNMSPMLGYAMTRGTYARSRTCHMATRQGLGHAMWQLYMTCHMAHRLGYHAMWHLINLFSMPHNNMIKLGATP
jgi:hypothetical protein